MEAFLNRSDVKLVELPPEITSIIAKYTWAWRAPTRPNWREGSSIIAQVKSDPLWQKWKERKEWQELNECCTTSNCGRCWSCDVVIGISVAICADLFLRLVVEGSI